MKQTLTLIFVLITTHLFAQNLVLNPSFEDYSACPSDSCSISNANNWFSVLGLSSYFNTCGSNGYHVPDNRYGHQQPATGNGYGEFYFLGGFAENMSEDLGGELSSSLIIGQKYFLSFKISLCDKSNAYSNGMGIVFSTVKYPDPCTVDFYNYIDPAVLKYHSDSLISDSINWVTLSGSFVADSAYKYFSIGYFGILDYINYLPNNLIHADIRYYLDDVCVSTDSLTCNTPTEIIENDFSKINIFPNPASNELTIDFALANKTSFELYDILGAKRKTVTFDNTLKPEIIDLTDIDSGLYFYVITARNGDSIKTGKLVIIK